MAIFVRNSSYLERSVRASEVIVRNYCCEEYGKVSLRQLCAKTSVLDTFTDFRGFLNSSRLMDLNQTPSLVASCSPVYSLSATQNVQEMTWKKIVKKCAGTTFNADYKQCLMTCYSCVTGHLSLT